MLPFNYKYALYRRNNFGQPCVWYAVPNGDKSSIIIYHGILGKTIITDIVNTNRDTKAEITSRTVAKRKAGYKLLSELKDNVSLPVEEELLNYLNSYLPTDRTTIEGLLLPMKAKVYDNTNNRVFKKSSIYIGQWKINGLRCFISAVLNSGDMFKPIKLIFQSCEGTVWNSLNSLEDYLLSVLDHKLVDKMIDEHYILDGEVYLPGHTVNEINHFVKDPNCPENKLLQYWCYDIAIENTIQCKRINFLEFYQSKNIRIFNNKEEHLANDDRFIVLPIFEIGSDWEATTARNNFINLGFEGLIMRNPEAEYQYGKRNLSMIKYKKSTDGKFTIIDIYPEGIKRSNIPLFLCKNDINDATFECHLSASLEYQSTFLQEDIKHATIGKQMYVEYGERSGVNDLPFHIQETRIL